MKHQFQFLWSVEAAKGQPEIITQHAQLLFVHLFQV